MLGKLFKRLRYLLGFIILVTCLFTWATLWHLNSTLQAGGHSATISCYDNYILNHIPDVSEYPPRKRGGIFFHETSCASAYDSEDFVFSARQACAVESAAKTNPDTEVTVLFLSPIPLKRVSDTKNAAVQALLKYPNVHIKHVSFARYVKDTPLELWYRSGSLRKSLWPVSHASDVMRYLTLWKHGGTYLDLDVVVLKSLKDLTNFAAAESIYSLGAGAINLDHSDLGRWIADAFLQELLVRFNGNEWGANGPGVITRVLERVCHVKEVQNFTRDRCGGFLTLPPSSFYPVTFWKWRDYFNETRSDAVMMKHKTSYAAHVWNAASKDEKVVVGSRQPYGLLAAQFCPNVYATCGTFF